MPNNLGLISKDEYVVQERPIKVTDEKLNRLLSNTYETARKDANSFKWYNHYGVFFSFSLSLFITLLTSTFNDFGIIKGEVLTIFAWIVLGISTIIGIALALLRGSKHSSDEHNERDEAVNKIIETILNNDNKK